MLKSFSVSNYRSLKKIIIPLSRLNVVTGPNGSGKSNLYKSLRLLSEVAKGNVSSSIAHDGGILSAFWAGPTSFTKAELAGKSDVQGKHEKALTRIDLGFSSDDFGFCISLGLPPPPVGGGSDPTMFTADPVVRRECIWVGDYYRPASCLVDRIGPVAKVIPITLINWSI
ncbi:AAA family ATPase [Vibrio tritonius]|uniref:AAA family ATPase n=1 Tax=Vibrio tritonius TaxID=1435069 RepID=A0ABS7YQR6_9VIBR|nr:AAA family ATPase [Vibrio tritonius]MCA2018031.1 AAA family ATPase [Vibrio tritonius]